MTMESDSSSDSEDTEKFKAACDPELSTIFEKSGVTESVVVNGFKEPATIGSQKYIGADQSCSQDHIDGRASFRLLERIQKALKAPTGGAYAATKESRNGRLSTVSHWRGRGRRDTLNTSESFMSKQLNEILQRNVMVEEKECSSLAENVTCADDTFHLTQEIVIDPSKSNTNLNQARTRHKKCKRKRKSVDSEEIDRPRKYNYYDSSDEEEIAKNCKNIALTPEHILDKMDVYPWPHPKNVRYFEEMRLVKKKLGVIMIAPLDSSQPSAKKKKAKKNIIESLDTKIRSDKSETTKEQSTVTPDVSDVKKKRKQTRKRGMKKKRKSGVEKEDLVDCT